MSEEEKKIVEIFKGVIEYIERKLEKVEEEI